MLKQLLKKFFPIILLFILFFVIPVTAQENEPAKQEAVILTDGLDEYPLGLYLGLLEDPNGELTIEEVTSSEFASRFVRSQVETPNFGYTDSAYWVRLVIDNQTTKTTGWLLEIGFPNTQYVDLYIPLSTGSGY